MKLAQAGRREAVVCWPIYLRVTRQTRLLNEEAVVIKFVVLYTIDFFLLDKDRMNDISSANKREVTGIPLLLQSCR
jgi:hypothetical protein